MAREMSLSELQKKLGIVEKQLPKDVENALRDDMEYISEQLLQSFDKSASETVIHGYYLEGSGPVYNDSTIAIPGDYQKKWQRPKIITNISGGQGVLNMIGTDATILEYGLAPYSTPMLQWVHNSEEGYENAHNAEGSGNWFEAIHQSAGNELPLLSYGESGSRFFARDSSPTMFARKTLVQYQKDLQSDNASVHLSKGGIKAIFEKEWDK